MRSLRSRIIIWLVRNRHLFKMKLKPEVIDHNFSVDEFRRGVDEITAKMKMPQGVALKKQSLGDLNAEWIIPRRALEGKALLYIHGGGFISGSSCTHKTHVAKFALGSGMKSLVFDYRLAPEHPFPGALEDCLTAYKWLLDDGYSPRDVIIGGESAGGALTLSLLLALKERGVDLPKAAFAISPVTDLRCRAGSFSYNAKKDITPEGSWEIWLKLYMGDNDPALPLISPLMGDLSGLPPLHICVGSHECVLDDCQAFAEKAAEQGVDVTFGKWPGMVHAFPLFAPLFPEASRALKEICDFARGHALRA